MKFLEAKDRTLADILNGSRFRIDSFQREYRWQRKQIEALISDLVTSFDKSFQDGDTISTYKDYTSYYMGPIVLCDDNRELSVVDGQQRLTSFTLLLIYLLHAQKELLDESLRADLSKHLYVRMGGKDTLILNVDSRKKVIEHLIKSPGSIYKDIDELEEDSDIGNKKTKDESILNIIERYEDITKLFPEYLLDTIKLPIFIEWLLHYVILVEIKAFSMDSAYTIFETMNDRGLSLNPTEILKGYLLSMIQDDYKSEEMNDFWKDRIFDIKSKIGPDSDLDFFRNWLRAKYAETKRSTAKGSENLDFEQIGTQFHSWVKNNSSKIFLKRSDDYYYFIKSDFDFYSSIYIDLSQYKSHFDPSFSNLFISNFYTIADSLSFPLFLSPISKVDDETSLSEKIHLVSRFIDNYTVTRTFQNKSITQSSIRNYIYDLVRDIRNADVTELKSILSLKLDELVSGNNSGFFIMQQMNNWGFYHYFFARILYFLQTLEIDFQTLLRSKRQNSYVMVPIFSNEDVNSSLEESLFFQPTNVVANFVLIRRFQIDEFKALNWSDKYHFLMQNNYIPEMIEYGNFNGVIDFIEYRDNILRDLVSEIWHF